MDELERLDEIKEGMEEMADEYNQMGYEADLEFHPDEQVIKLVIIDGKDDFFIKLSFGEIKVSEDIYVEQKQKYINEVSISVRITCKINEEENSHPLGRDLIRKFTEKTALQIPEEQFISVDTLDTIKPIH
ncbi:hypothetical protein U8V72_20365 [Priestia filamentosa]|uniref:hypothetical protein n=1 Tax=Priestia filamentosa TaxID=1402861 RepID=UPI000589549E